MNNIYTCGGVNKDIVVNTIAAEFIRQGLETTKLKTELMAMDAFDQNRKPSVALLSLYEATTIGDDGKIKISYDQAYTLLNSFGETFSLDHLLVQTPDPNSNEFQYYKDPAEDVLVLKDDHDFPSDIVNGMDYDTFTFRILNQIGNLRIYYKDKNSSRQNSPVELKDSQNVHSYKEMVTRGKHLVDTIIDHCLPTPDIDLSQIQTSNSKKSEANLPKMEKLIEFGIVKPGDKLYITQKPDDSVATLIDEKYVDYNGDKLTLNDWGCKVTGWVSIRIYAYVAIVGETETLHQKRLAFIQEHNEPIS